MYAWTAAFGKNSRSRASCRYSGRKSWPQWLTQCASSTATVCAPASRSSRYVPVLMSRSGDVNTSRVSPLRIASDVAANSSLEMVLSSRAAGTPMRVRPST